MRRFVTSLGKPFEHHDLIKLLLDAIMLPAQLAIVKRDAHTSGTDSVRLEMSDLISLTSVVHQCASLQLTQSILLPSFNDVAAF